MVQAKEMDCHLNRQQKKETPRKECDKQTERTLRLHHGHIKYMNTKAKCRLLKIDLWKGRVYLSDAPYPPPPPPTHCKLDTVYLFTQGRGGGGAEVEPERRGEGQHRRVQIPKLG